MGKYNPLEEPVNCMLQTLRAAAPNSCRWNMPHMTNYGVILPMDVDSPFLDSEAQKLQEVLTEGGIKAKIEPWCGSPAIHVKARKDFTTKVAAFQEKYKTEILATASEAIRNHSPIGRAHIMFDARIPVYDDGTPIDPKHAVDVLKQHVIAVHNYTEQWGLLAAVKKQRMGLPETVDTQTHAFVVARTSVEGQQQALDYARSAVSMKPVPTLSRRLIPALPDGKPLDVEHAVSVLADHLHAVDAYAKKLGISHALHASLPRSGGRTRAGEKDAD